MWLFRPLCFCENRKWKIEYSCRKSRKSKKHCPIIFCLWIPLQYAISPERFCALFIFLREFLWQNLCKHVSSKLFSFYDFVKTSFTELDTAKLIKQKQNVSKCLVQTLLFNLLYQSWACVPKMLSRLASVRIFQTASRLASSCTFPSPQKRAFLVLRLQFDFAFFSRP